MSTPEDVLRVLTGAPASTRPRQFPELYVGTVTRVGPGGAKFTIAAMGQVELGPARYLQPFSDAGPIVPPSRGDQILVAFVQGDPHAPIVLGLITE